jgi:hypothetical protein
MTENSLAPNLRDKDFRGKNLEGKDLSHADIRGADFSHANLTNAKFRQVKAGLPPSWTIGLVTFSLILAFLAGLTSAYGGAVIGYLVMGNADELRLFGFLAAITLAIFLFIVIARGLGTMRTLAEIIAAGIIAATVLVAIIAFSPEQESGLKIALAAEFTIMGLVGVAAGILNMALGVAIAKTIILPNPKILTSAIAFLGTILGAILGVRQTGAFFIAGILAIITIVLGTHIGFQAISNNQKYWLIRWLAITIVASRGTRFIGANLTDADFTQANLTHTDFSNANLTRTRWLQAEGLDFARREVASSYEIVELSVGDSINPQSAAIALQQLAQKYPDKFELLAIEGGGENNLKFHAKVTETETPLQLSDKLNQIYRQIQLLPDTTKEQILLEEKDRYVDRLENLLTKAIEKPNYYFETEGNVTMTQNKGNVNISGTQGNIGGVVAAGENQTMTGVAIGAISGSVTNTINQLPETSQSEQPNLKELLTQLQKAIETETELPNEDKAEALEQVKTLAEAGQTPEDNNLQKAAKTAMKILKGTTAGLSETTKLVLECSKLLPAISALLMLV